MSGLIVPAFAMPKRQEIRLPPIEVPKALEEDFAVNPHLEPEFFRAVGRAVSESLNDPETTIREPTAEKLSERIESCYKTVLIMRMEMKYPLRKCFDLLPQMFKESLRSGVRTEDLVEKAVGQATAWAKGSAPKEVEVDRDPEADLAKDAEKEL